MSEYENILKQAVMKLRRADHVKAVWVFKLGITYCKCRSTAPYADCDLVVETNLEPKQLDDFDTVVAITKNLQELINPELKLVIMRFPGFNKGREIEIKERWGFQYNMVPSPMEWT